MEVTIQESVRSRIAEDETQASAEVRALLAVIRERLFEPDFDIGELLDECDAPWRFQHELGLGIRAYVDRRRWEAALEMVRTSPLPITDVARLLGFAGPETFTKWFKRRTGHAPSKMRRNPRSRRPSARRLATALWRETLLGSLGPDDYVALLRSLRAQYPQAFQEDAT